MVLIIQHPLFNTQIRFSYPIVALVPTVLLKLLIKVFAPISLKNC